MSGPWFIFDLPCSGKKGQKCGCREADPATYQQKKNLRGKVSGETILCCRKCEKIRRVLPPIGGRQYDDEEQELEEQDAVPRTNRSGTTL